VYTLAALACRAKLVVGMVEILPALPFEARKDAAQIFGCLVRLHLRDDSTPGCDQVLMTSEDVWSFMVDG
jgi:hypothetical protein